MRWRWEREGVKDGCYNLLLAAAACPWPDRSAIGYLKWATCVADLDSAALALTKEASGNSRGVCVCACVCGEYSVCVSACVLVSVCVWVGVHVCVCIVCV